MSTDANRFRIGWSFPVLLLCLAYATVGYTDEKQSRDNKRGSIVDGNTYNNPALAIGESTQLVYRLHNAISTARVCRVSKGSGYG